MEGNRSTESHMWIRDGVGSGLGCPASEVGGLQRPVLSIADSLTQPFLQLRAVLCKTSASFPYFLLSAYAVARAGFHGNPKNY